MASETNELMKFFNLDILFTLFFFATNNFCVSILLCFFKVVIKIILFFLFKKLRQEIIKKIILKKLRFVHATWITLDVSIIWCLFHTKKMRWNEKKFRIQINANDYARNILAAISFRDDKWSRRAWKQNDMNTCKLSSILVIYRRF